MPQRIHVVAAVIRSATGEVLIAKRPVDKHQGGLWEFPGGKVEAGESVTAALSRELHEELGITVEQARPLIQIRHDYPDRHVLLDVWEISVFSGEPHGAEGQPLIWVPLWQLQDYSFPEANVPIVTAAMLPDRYLITPAALDHHELLQGIRQALVDGCRLLLLRTPQLAGNRYRALAQDVQALCAGKAQLMLKGPLEWLADFPAAGWHLSSDQLRQLADSGRPLSSSRWLAASCHDAEELALAGRIGVDFVTLSPIRETATHPQAPVLGFERAAELLQGCNRPAYLLGGLTSGDLPQAWAVGAQGVAGIRAFWPAD